MAEIIGTTGDDILVGGSDHDVLTGLAGQDRLSGGAGNDTLDGGANGLFVGLGGDVAEYFDSGAAFVVVDLALGRADDGLGGTDTLISIENVTGTNGNDRLLGDNTNNGLRGNGGNDFLDGRGGVDFASYFSDPAGVNVDLASGIARDGFGGADTLVSIEGINGSAFSDTLRGNSGDNFLHGFAGDDILDGRGGSDFVCYFSGAVTAGVQVNLATGIAQDGQGGADTLISIENIYGSSFADTLTGNADNNVIFGLSGDDSIIGGRGMDISGYRDARGQYTVSSSEGTVTVAYNGVGRDGVDTLQGIERVEFSDGYLAFDNSQTDIAGRAYLVYRAAFDRAPDAQGLGYWINELEVGKDYGSVVAASFIISDEFVRTYGSNVSNARFIELVYMNVLDRMPDQAGYDYWLNNSSSGLNNGYARSNLLASFAVSNENYAAVSPTLTDGMWYIPYQG